jgi:hypothetical protein
MLALLLTPPAGASTGACSVGKDRLNVAMAHCLAAAGGGASKTSCGRLAELSPWLWLVRHERRKFFVCVNASPS